MATSIGKKSANVFVWILLLLLIIGLAGFGATSFGGGTTAVATVGEREISTSRYFRAAQQTLRNYQQQTGTAISVTQPEGQQLLEALRAQLIRAAAVENEADQIGLSVGDGEVAKQIRAIPNFAAIDGSFDRTAYELALRQTGMSVSDFEDGIRRDRASGILRGAVAGAAKHPAVFADQVLTYLAESRDFRVVRFDTDVLGEDPVPTPDAAAQRAFYDTNPEVFTLPARKSITYVWVTPDMMLDNISVSDDDLRPLYEERIESYRMPERRLVERLIYSGAQAAQEASARLTSGEADFDTLVAERNLTLEDVDLGEATRASLGRSADAVFALTQPGVTAPVETDLGPALFRINAVLSAQEVSFEQAREDLRNELALDRARRRIDASIDEINDLLAAGGTLEEAARDTDLVLETVEYFAGSPEIVTAYPAFRNAANRVTGADFPEVMTLEDGGIFALRLDDELPPSLQPIDDVREAVIEGAARAADTARLLELANELVAQMTVGAEIGAAGLEVENYTRQARRNAVVEDAPQSLMEAIFEMNVGDVETVEGIDTVYVIALDAITAPDQTNEELTGLRTAIDLQLAQSLSADIFQFYSEALTAQTGISLNVQAINSVNAELR
ncbi:MAG: peptidyl-prolyl cis-trans isomerase D [Paracoccaceae bacterium]|jgi:peptidyl-prolyl cis-trans isomerase D